MSTWREYDEFSILRAAANSPGVKGTFTLLDLAPTPNLWREQLDRIEKAQSEGTRHQGASYLPPGRNLNGAPSINAYLLRKTDV